MPKQMIYSRDFGRQVPVATDGDGPIELHQMPQHMVKVGWSKERGDVQLAVLHDHNGLIIEHGFPQELGFLEAGDITEIDDPTDRELLARLTPLYIDLDRAGINQLIRTLRKARDDAFGADA